MVFGSPFKPKGNIVLQAPDNSQPGELTPIEIRVIPGEEIQPREVRAELVGEETFYVTETHYSGGHTTTQTVQKNEAFANITQTVAEQPTLSKGVEQEWRCSLHLPSDAPHTCRGKLVNVRWTLKAVLDVPKRADLSQEKPLYVFFQPPQTDNMSVAPAEKSFREVTLILKAPPAARTGDTLKGQLTLQTKEKLSINGVRVELVQVEEAGTRSANEVVSTTKLSGSASFNLNEAPVFEFTLNIPAEAPPTVVCRRSSLRWEVRAVIDRRMKTDFNVTQEVLLHLAPPVKNGRD
jgi:hypothetical protein